MEGALVEWFASWTVGVFLLLLGLCVGSFLNVCIYRLPAGKSIIWPASHCTSCQTPIAWYDNIPVASYLVLGGKCRGCGAPFSARYMLVELATGLVWFWYWAVYFKTGLRPGADHPGVYLSHMVLASALLVSGLIDLDRKEIYTSVTNVALAVGVAAAAVWPDIQRLGAYDHVLPNWTGWGRVDAPILALVGAAVGAGLINLTRFLGTLAFRREAMGAGDVYLMALIGGILGWEAALLVFLVAPFLGLPYGIWQVLRQEKEPQAEAAGDKGEKPVPVEVNYGTFVATVIGLACFLTAAWMGRPEWCTPARLLLVGGLMAMGVSFFFLAREVSGDAEPAESDAQPAPESDSHEVPYGPFLGLAAGVVMLIQEHAVGHFGPGIEALLHAIAG